MKKLHRLSALSVTLLLLAGCGGGGGLQSPEPPPSASAPTPAAPTPPGTPAGPDATPPTVLFTTPTTGATGVSVSSTVRLLFSEAVAPDSVTAANVAISGVTGALAVNGSEVILTPAAPLDPSTTYSGTVRGGAAGVTDLAGNALAADVPFSFTTAAALVCGGNVRCVGAGKAYATIQAAVDASGGGDTVVVFSGFYEGFTVERGGSSANRLIIRAEGPDVVIDEENGNGEGITLNDVDYVTVEGFTVLNMPEFGIATHDASVSSPMHGIHIRNNTVKGSDLANIYVSHTADSLVEGNTVSGSGSSHGIYVANGGSDNTVIRNNVSFSNASNGFHFNGDSSQGGDGLQTGLTVDGNVAFFNDANGLNMDGVANSTFQNNLVYDNGRNGMRFYRIDAGSGPVNLRIVNNTVDVAGGSGWAIKITEDGGGHVVFNNILVSPSSAEGGSLAVGNPTFTSNFNRLSDKFSLDGDVTTIGFSAWKAAGHDGASLTATASDLFVNPSSEDYLLRDGSSAANQGVASLGGVTAPLTDVRKAVRPQGSAHDIGAYEQF